MNESLAAVSIFFRRMSIGAGDARLNTYAQRFSREVPAGFEPAIFRLIHGCLNHQTLQPGLQLKIPVANNKLSEVCGQLLLVTYLI